MSPIAGYVIVLLPILISIKTEERKQAILFAATLLSARKIIEVIENDDSMNMGRAF